MFVAIAEGTTVEKGTTVENGAMVEEVAVGLGSCFQAVEDASELARVVTVDLREFFFLVVAVVGKVVVAVVNTRIWIRAIAAVVGDDERGDAGGVS